MSRDPDGLYFAVGSCEHIIEDYARNIDYGWVWCPTCDQRVEVRRGQEG